MNRASFLTPIILAFVGCVLTSPLSAQDGLTVRDVLVLEGSNYDDVMNSRGNVKSTLPRSIAGRRQIENEQSQPFPLGLITFEGTPAADFDVLIEYNGRLMTHFPSGSSRSKRILWGRLSLAKELGTDPAILSPDHWLSKLDLSLRLWVQSPASGAAKFLLYDVEHKEKPLATIAVNGDEWSIKNTGRDPIHNAAIIRPLGDGKFALGYLENVEGYRPDKDAVPAAEKPKSEADPEAVKAVGTLVGGLVEAVIGNPQPTTQPAEKPAFTPKATTVDEPGHLEEVSFSSPADKATIVAQYAEQLADLGPPEKEYIQQLLNSRGPGEESALLVYQLDEKTLTRIAPLEITPFPQRLTRTALVIVPDADPSLSDEIDRLIAQLGDDSWLNREAAEKRLKELGGITERNLKAASGSTDWEIRDRSQRLLKELTTVNQ